MMGAAGERKGSSELKLSICLFCMGMVATFTAASSARAEAPTSDLPTSLRREAAIDASRAQANAAKLTGLGCVDILQNLPQRETRNPFNIPDIEWTPELYGALRQRAHDCSVRLDRNDQATVRSRLNYGERFLLPRGQAARVATAVILDVKRQLISRASDAAMTGSGIHRHLLDALQHDLHSSRLSRDDQAEVAAAILRARVEAEAIREAEVAEEQKAAQAQRAAQLAEAERSARDHEARLADVSPSVRAFIGKNGQLLVQSPDDVAAVLRGIYAMEVSVRLCARETGGYARELRETVGRRTLIEDLLVKFHKTDGDRLKNERALLGVATATGRVADMLTADQFALRQGCDGALAFSSSFFDFGN